MKRTARIVAPFIAAIALSAALAASAVAAAPKAGPFSAFHFAPAPPVYRV